MTTLILALLLSGSLPEASLRLKVHLGNDARSNIIRSELTRHDAWWLEHRLAIARTHRLVVDDEAFREPCYQIGSGERLPFPAGACAFSGAAMLTLRSIAATDAWEREYVNPYGYWEEGDFVSRDPDHESRKPVQFPKGSE